MNEAKIDFTLTENDDDTAFILDVACYRFMDTSLIGMSLGLYITMNIITNKRRSREPTEFRCLRFIVC